MFVYMFVYGHIYIYTYMYIHIHTYMCVESVSRWSPLAGSLCRRMKAHHAATLAESEVMILWDVIMCEGLTVILRIAVSILQVRSEARPALGMDGAREFLRSHVSCIQH